MTCPCPIKWRLSCILLTGLMIMGCTSSEPEFTFQTILEVSDELKSQQGTDNNQITIYSVTGHPATYRAMTTAQIYGLKPKLVPISHPNDVDEKLPSDIVADLKSQKIEMPLFKLGNEKIISPELFYKAIKELKVESFQPNQPDHYVILYGIQNCSITDRARKKLNSHGIQYAFIDINSNSAKYLGEIAAKIDITSNETEWKQPCIETDNQMWCNGSTGFQSYLDR